VADPQAVPSPTGIATRALKTYRLTYRRTLYSSIIQILLRTSDDRQTSGLYEPSI